jgi:hypothetical protein
MTAPIGQKTRLATLGTGRPTMKKAADALCVLATFSIRTQFYEKAIRYAKCGYQLFQDDYRFVELYAFTLLLNGSYAQAEEILRKTNHRTWNIALLRCRCAILLELPRHEKQVRARAYLRYSA